jgi:hypothetical protein
MSRYDLDHDPDELRSESVRKPQESSGDHQKFSLRGRPAVESHRDNESAQTLYHGFVKWREADHDAAVYKLYQKAADDLARSVPDPGKFDRARRMFQRFFGTAPANSPDDLICYFKVRKLWDEKKYNSLTREDRDLLRAGSARYAAERFQLAYTKWLAGGAS